MSKPDTQRFDRDGIWRKPPGAVRVDMTLKGGEATTHAYVGHGGGGQGGSSGGGYLAASSSVSVSGYIDARGPATEAEVVTQSFAADDLPDLIEVEVGKGGRPGGRDGYALIVTHLQHPQEPPQS